MASQGAKSAAKTQADAAARAQGQLLATGQEAADLYGPYASRGVSALNMLNYGLGDTSIQKAGAARAPVSNIPAGYSLTPPPAADGSIGRAYTTVMPSDGNQFVYNNETGDRIVVPTAVAAAETP
jgi:hypothetical protein